MRGLSHRWDTVRPLHSNITAPRTFNSPHSPPWNVEQVGMCKLSPHRNPVYAEQNQKALWWPGAGRRHAWMSVGSGGGLRPVSGRAAILRCLDLVCALTACSSSLICSYFAKSMNSVRQEGSVCLHTTDTVVHRKEPPLLLGSHYSPRATHSYTHSATSLSCLSVGAVHECQRRAG